MADERDKRSEPPSDRRAEKRHLACFPTDVATHESTVRAALIRDLSVTGARLLTVDRFDVGARVTLSLYLPGLSEAQPRVVAAVVIRDERRPPEIDFPWRHAVAVCFDEPMPDIEGAAKALADEQDRTFGRER